MDQTTAGAVSAETGAVEVKLGTMRTDEENARVLPFPVTETLTAKLDDQPTIIKKSQNLIGKDLVANELDKWRVFAKVTYAAKSDVYAIGKNGTELRIRVRTTRQNIFFTHIDQLLLGTVSHPDFWVLVQFLELGGERFFVLSDQKICEIQEEVNSKHLETHPRTKRRDNVKVEHVNAHEAAWEKLIEVYRRSARVSA